MREVTQLPSWLRLGRVIGNAGALGNALLAFEMAAKLPEFAARQHGREVDPS
jgi:cytochrome c-type biogenesis protein CcmH/NrfG